MAWSQYQENIFAAVSSPDAGNVIVRAGAGSGKTSTSVEAYKRAARPGCSAVFLAFNKAIADELKARGVNARTFHSACYSAVLGDRGVREVDARKGMRVFNSIPSREGGYPYRKFVTKLVGLAKQMGMGCSGMMPDVEDSWISLVSHHELELDDDLDLGTAIELASKMLDLSYKDKAVDFDDMLYFAVRDNLPLPKFDLIFLDEAQDTNAIQRELLRKMMKPTTRLVAVGDPAQSIYGFRGADSNSMQLIKSEFDCTELPLTISYRCPTLVVQYANQWVPELEAAPGAKPGIVKHLKMNWDLQTFKEGDLIICRTTRQIVTLGFKFIREQIPATIMGKEIGEGLKALIKKMGTNDLNQLVERTEAWRDREAGKALHDGDEAKAETVYDKADAIINIVEGMPEDMRNIDQVYSVLEYLFSPNRNAITLATIHKSKGLEAKRVFWLNREKCPAQWSKAPWQQQQERNLCYVATTRAKEELYFLDERTTFNKAPESVILAHPVIDTKATVAVEKQLQNILGESLPDGLPF